MLCEGLAFVNTGADGPDRNAVRKLLDAVEARETMFDPAQRAHLDAWRLRVIMPLQLGGDDGFVYNRTARNARELIAALPAVDPEEDAALQRILVRRCPLCRPFSALVSPSLVFLSQFATLCCCRRCFHECFAACESSPMGVAGFQLASWPCVHRVDCLQQCWQSGLIAQLMFFGLVLCCCPSRNPAYLHNALAAPARWRTGRRWRPAGAAAATEGWWRWTSALVRAERSDGP